MSQTKSPSLTYFWHKKTILSFIAIVFVVIIHNSATKQYATLTPDTITTFTDHLHNFFAYILGSVAVPFLFFVSGIAFFRNYKPSLYLSKLKSRTKSLLIPYLIWNLFGLLFAVLYTYTPLSSYISGRELFTPTPANILAGLFLYKYNFQFWFLFDLMFYVLITPVINLLIRHKSFGLITCLLALLLININTNFTIFYILGCYVGKHYLPHFTQPSIKSLRLTSLLAAILTLTIQSLSFYNIINLPPAISGLILVLLLLSLYFAPDFFLTKIKTTPKFTKESFPLYTLHTYFIAIIIKLIYLINPNNSLILLINEISSTVITILIVVLISYLLHQKLPKLHAFLFGGR